MNFITFSLNLHRLPSMFFFSLSLLKNGKKWKRSSLYLYPWNSNINQSSEDLNINDMDHIHNFTLYRLSKSAEYDYRDLFCSLGCGLNFNERYRWKYTGPNQPTNSQHGETCNIREETNTLYRWSCTFNSLTE